MTAVGAVLLHTSPAHVPVFDALRDRNHPGAVLRHLVVPQLLARARVEGPEAVAPALLEVLAGAVARAAVPVLVTCSTIGATAESLAPELGVPVLRVDRPMAAAAVAAGRRMAVLATVESTFAPTCELLAEEAGERPLSISRHLVPGAWERFEAGDIAGNLALVAAAADALAPAEADVIVLAQASMAGAADLVTTRIPVLSSPARGLAAVLGPQPSRAGES
ncbi:aspartate/glutamate racemase family protein [Streptomyces sp. NPDC088762]|uniref:aspartate/glutamate racemase family protein n=1 Tax=Streptomyces sp. NPDC088762 TaxID=3365891 RepID=UPI00381E75BB